MKTLATLFLIALSLLVLLREIKLWKFRRAEKERKDFLERTHQIVVRVKGLDNNPVLSEKYKAERQRLLELKVLIDHSYPSVKERTEILFNEANDLWDTIRRNGN